MIHDEASYLLQAKIFASGRWVAPARPLPEFFEQFHVLVTPVTASKYPPGQALALTPAVLAGLPGLSPALLGAAAGTMLFVLTARWLGPLGGFLTWLVWISAPGTLRILPSYLSQPTSLALWLAALLAFLRWRDRGGSGWLAACAFLISCDAVTRPFSTVFLAMPMILAAGISVLRRNEWRTALITVAAALPVLALVPLQNLETTGRADRSAYQVYNRLYLPFDALGFRPDAPAPSRQLPPDINAYSDYLRALHRASSISRLPAVLVARLRWIAADVWGHGRWLLIAAALLGLPRIRGETWLFAGGSIVQVLAHLAHVHPATSSVYAFEAEPLLAFATGAGLLTAISRVSRLRIMAGLGGRILAVGAAAVAGLLGVVAIRTARGEHEERASEQRAFRAAMEHLPETPAIVFVRYGPLHDFRKSLIDNEPDLERAPVWIVYDRGADNVRLRRLAPDRAAYLFDEARHRLSMLPQADRPKSL